MKRVLPRPNAACCIAIFTLVAAVIMVLALCASCIFPD
jgi:hypothetical protein